MNATIDRLRRRTSRSREQLDDGFTLIELLVVMIIIGILAAIAIPVFLSQKNKAKDTSAKSDVNTISKNVQSYYVDGTGALTVATSNGLWTLSSGSGPTASTFASGSLSSGNTASGTVTADGNWCVQVKNSVAGAGTYSVSASNGYKTSACSGSSN